MKHELKIKPEYFAAVFFGEKTFEIRNNTDRNFQVGDTLLLKAWDGEFNGDFVEKVVSYITDFEQKPGYVVLGLVNDREHELLEKFHRTGVAIERAISTGSVLADHPLKSRLELLANHHKREQDLADGMVAMAERCNLLADLLREVTQIVPVIGVATDDLPVVDAFLERIEAALAGKMTNHLEQQLHMAPEEWRLVPAQPTPEMWDAMSSCHQSPACQWVAALAAAPKSEPMKGRTITEGQEFELTTVLQSIANGFSDNPAHDAAALLKRIAGEVPWTGDSFQIPPRQGGELCDSASPSSSPD